MFRQVCILCLTALMALTNPTATLARGGGGGYHGGGYGGGYHAGYGGGYRGYGGYGYGRGGYYGRGYGYGRGFGGGFGAGLGFGYLFSPWGYGYIPWSLRGGYGYGGYGNGGYGGYGNGGYGGYGYDNSGAYSPLPAYGYDDSGAAPPLTGSESGLQITDLTDGPAKKAQLHVGDIILGIGQTRTQTFDQLQSALAAAKGQAEVVFINNESKNVEKLPVTPVDGKLGIAVVPAYVR